MTVEITGVNTWNKGAELMLVAIRDRFRSLYPEVQLVVDQSFGTYRERARHGLALKPALPKLGRAALAMRLMPETLRRTAGLTSAYEVDAVLDASGFAFSDQLPEKRIVASAAFAKAVRDEGKPFIMLPQALRPFQKEGHQRAFRSIARDATLIFARDEMSLSFARNASRGEGQLRMAPDFTNLVKPALTSIDRHCDRVCIVPNQRMIEKAADDGAAAAYVPTMLLCVREVLEAGLQPVLLLHGRNDASVFDSILDVFGKDMPVIEEEDPVEIKRILGESRLVIGSRFHALASALSQGVPCIATSWSHKYEMLFRDYGCQGMVLNVPADPSVVHARIAEAAGHSRSELLEVITRNGAKLEASVRRMWQEVDLALGLSPSPAAKVTPRLNESTERAHLQQLNGA